MKTTTTPAAPVWKTATDATPRHADGLDDKAVEKFWEEGCKTQARILLHPIGKRAIIIPTQEEWIGINLLDRDGEL